MSTNVQIRIYNLLSNKQFYSLRLDYISNISDIPIKYLRLLDQKSNSISRYNFSERFHDEINIFNYNDIEYMGLESRRLDYEHDKINGTNWVEEEIKRGTYDLIAK